MRFKKRFSIYLPEFQVNITFAYNQKHTNMRTSSPSELRGNIKKYLDLSVNEKITTQWDGNENFVQAHEDYLEPDEDLRRAVNAQELLAGIESDIRKAYREKYGHKA